MTTKSFIVKVVLTDYLTEKSATELAKSKLLSIASLQVMSVEEIEPRKGKKNSDRVRS